MPLQEMEFDWDDDTGSLPPAVQRWLVDSQTHMQRYWDQFPNKPLPQYVECDFNYVACALAGALKSELIDGQLFVEWGCGLGIITGVAALLGLESIGIEAEESLCLQARRLLTEASVPAEIWQANFLPEGAELLAEDQDPLVSLSHSLPAGYEAHDFSLSDFAAVFVYPWPGEEHFLKAVFERYARPGALLLMFRGPYQIEFYRQR